MQRKRLTNMYSRALQQRWPINEEYRKHIIQRLVRIAVDPETPNREAISAIKGIMAAESQNQKDEHIAAIQSDRNRILELVEQLGFAEDPQVIREITAETTLERIVESREPEISDDGAGHGYQEEEG